MDASVGESLPIKEGVDVVYNRVGRSPRTEKVAVHTMGMEMRSDGVLGGTERLADEAASKEPAPPWRAPEGMDMSVYMSCV